MILQFLRQLGLCPLASGVRGVPGSLAFPGHGRRLRLTTEGWYVINRSVLGVRVGALKKKTYSEILRPSVGKTKLRAAYSRPPEIALGGLIAGAGAFLSPLIVYAAGSFLAGKLRIRGPNIGRMEWLIDYFGIRVFKGSGFDSIVVNLLVLTLCFAAIGVLSAFIYRVTTMAEDSSVFFRRRLRFPFEVLPFFAILLLATLLGKSFDKAWHFLLGLVVCTLIGGIWKFYYSKMLSLVSTADVSRIIPDIDG